MVKLTTISTIQRYSRDGSGRTVSVMSALFLERFQPAVSKQMKISEAFDLTNRTASRGDGRPARKRILGRRAGGGGVARFRPTLAGSAARMFERDGGFFVNSES